MLSFAYSLLTDLGAPAIGLYLKKRRAAGREDETRFRERLGYASKPRPPGRLIWCHAASVGEATSLLTLIGRLGELYPDTRFLVTTGTVAAARMLAERLPGNVVHQYIPVDRRVYVRRFLDHWRPDLVLWVESELWPNMLAAVRVRRLPAVLLNGRMSDKSFRSWGWAKGWARDILSAFALCLTQTEEARERFAALGGENVRMIGNLKYAGNPLPCNEQTLARFQERLNGRPVWGMVSTHRGEEEVALAAHRLLSAKRPDILTIIVPRHAARGVDIERYIGAHGPGVARRSKGDVLAPETGVYIADTMGELGLFYRLCPVVAIGGSFVPVGGHNPIEAAQLGAAIIFGPHMHHFSAIAREFVDQKAALQLPDAEALAPAVERLLSQTEERARYVSAAHALAAQKRHVLDEVISALGPWLGPAGKKAAGS